MRYHEMKLRDAAKMATIGAVVAAVVTLMLLFRSMFSKQFLDGPYVPLMAGLAVSVILAGAGVLWYFATTPAQNAKFLEKRKHRAPEPFDWTLLDESDPFFHMTTWRYLRRRGSSRK